MCWMCDHPGATQQDYFDELRSRVQKHGWAVQYVEIDRAPYAYTSACTTGACPNCW